MDDETILTWLIQITSHIAELHGRRNQNNKGPRFHEVRTFDVEDEGFSRWMGWRGEEEQIKETDWPAGMVRDERSKRHIREFKKLREENEEMKRFLWSLRDELNRRFG